MASIQQSYNQLFGALAGVATAGAYMYRQSPTYEAKQAEKGAEKLSEAISERTKIDPDKPFTAEERKSIMSQAEAAVEARTKALNIKPTPERAERLAKSMETKEGLANIFKGAEAKEYEEAAEAVKREIEDERRFEEAEAYMLGQEMLAQEKGLKRVSENINKQRNQNQSLEERFDFYKHFSAKEKAQFESAINRHRKKGEID